MRARKLIRVALSALVVPAGVLCFSESALATPVAPAVLSEGVPSVTPFEARLEAVVDAGEEATECDFQYGKASVTEHEVLCEGQLPLEGGEQGVGVTVKGLTSATLYHYRVVVKNATGEVKGTGKSTEEEFTTLTQEKPIVESENVSAVQSSSATLEAQVNPNYQKTTYEFEYATNKALTGAKTAVGAGELEGFGGQTVSVALTGLEPGENYYYRVVATNETGSSDGVVPAPSFTTLPVPATDTPTNVTGTSATFNGHFTLTPQDTRYSFDYALGGVCTAGSSTPVVDAGTGTSVARPEWAVPSPENPGFYSAAPPLHPDSQYSVCLVTSNAFGSQVGPEVHFATPPTPPTVDSESEENLADGGAVLQAMIDPNLQETTYLFEYAAKETGGTLENPTKVSGTAALPGELAELPASVVIAGLASNTTYYYRAVAENTTPLTENGPLQTLLTFPNTPTTQGASAVTTSTARITGTVDPSSHGQPAGHETMYFFQYGNDEAYGQRTPTESAGEGPTPTPETATLAGLLAGRTYHYRIVASNENNGTTQLTYGQDETFTTTGTPLLPTPPSNGSGEAPPQSTSSTTTAPVFPNLTTITPVPTTKEAGETTPPSEPKSLTRAQKLTKALKVCKREKGAKRSACEKAAHSKYGPVKRTKKKAKK